MPVQFGADGVNDGERVLLPRCGLGAPHAGRARRVTVVMLLCLSVWVVPSTNAQVAGRQSPPHLVSVSDLDSTIVLDIRYATADNFVGVPVDGYDEPLCLLTEPAARALAAANALATERGYRILVFDCYRPQRAVDHFVRWSYYALDQRTKPAYYPNVEKRLLFEYGYIASKSGHSRGSTVDVSLVLMRDSVVTAGQGPIDMGTPFDFFDTLSHTDAPGITERQRDNRQALLDIMRAAGFRNYSKEWWHYTLVGEPYPDSYFNVPVRRESPGRN